LALVLLSDGLELGNWGVGEQHGDLAAWVLPNRKKGNKTKGGKREWRGERQFARRNKKSMLHATF
jgi:hypothetical protein